MIRITYTPICDLCKTECPAEVFDCMNNSGLPYPLPSNRYTYTCGYTLNMCDICALPLQGLRDQILEIAIAARSKV
jgi:hypothetical protein